MMEVVSISLGPSERDRTVVIRIAGERVRVRRIGTDLSYLRALAAIRELDGRVAAMGLGGINLSYRLDGRSWSMPGARVLLSAARCTPIVDGSEYKDAVEPLAVSELSPCGGTALAVSMLDRPRIPAVLRSAGYGVRVGDPWFALGIPMFPEPRGFESLARASMPLLSRIPLSRVYGERALRPSCSVRFDVVWGDLRLLRRRPIALQNVSVVTSSLRLNDVEWLRRSGAGRIISVTPPVRGEGYGANVWEAVMVALGGRRLSGPELRTAFQKLMGRVGWSWPFDHPELTG